MLFSCVNVLHTAGGLKDSTNRSVWSKTTLITSSVGGAKAWILLLVKRVHFFLGPWLSVWQFIEIFVSNKVAYEMRNRLNVLGIRGSEYYQKLYDF